MTLVMGEVVNGMSFASCWLLQAGVVSVPAGVEQDTDEVDCNIMPTH
jgi:hypothetical protein